MVKKSILSVCLFVTVTLGLLLMLPSVQSSAVGKASVKITVVQDDNKTLVTGLGAKLYDSAGNDITSTAGSANVQPGVYEFNTITEKGTYVVELSRGVAKYSFNVSVVPNTLGSISAKRIVWIDRAALTPNKSGVLGGITTDGNGNIITNVTVKAYNASGVWESESNAIGAYKLYVPAGAYTLVIVGKDGSGQDYKNLFTTIKVTAGNTCGTLTELSALTTWSADAAAFNYTLAPISSDVKIVKGTASNNCTVSIYLVDDAGKYTYLASSKVTPQATGIGKFAITLPNYQPGKKLSIKVVDQAFNTYEDTTYVTTPIAKRNMILTPTTPSAVSCTVDTPVVISFKDASTVMNTYLASNITTFSAVGLSDSTPVTLATTTDFTVSGGKITIKAGKLSTAQDYNITVKAVGYNDTIVKQTVSTPIRIPGAISGTFTAVAGTTAGSTKFSTIGTPVAGNSLVYLLVAPTAAAQYKDNVISGTSSALLANTDISGIGPSANKCIDIYEITAANVIVNYKRVSVATTQIKAPLILSASVNGNTMTLVSDATLKPNWVPPISSFKVLIGTVENKPTAVTVSGTNIILTLTRAYTSSDTGIKVKYSRPAIGYLQDLYGNTIASQTSDLNVTNNTPVPIVSVTGVQLDQSTVSVSQSAGTVTLIATVSPGNATNASVTWSSTDTSVATVSGGIVTLVGTGTTTIGVQTVDGGFTDSCDITVN